MVTFRTKIKGYDYREFKDPYQENAPWPTMRGDIKNSGRLRELKWKGHSDSGAEVVHFQTGNAIFSTPIIDAKERIYVGSADHFFYAFDPHSGKVLWNFDAGEIIDCAGCIDKNNTIYVATGCSKIHAFTPEGMEKWNHNNLINRRKDQFTFSTNYWYEANIVLGPDDAIYVANDDFFVYKMTKNGETMWGYRTGFMVWSACSFWKDGTVYSAGFDHLLYALDMDTGNLKWKTDLKGALVGSPAVGENGTIYQTSFGGKLWAVDHNTGAVRWELDTGSHVYASVAVSKDHKLYFGSTNGNFYCVDGLTGKINWTYYIGDAIRASASLGPDPEGKSVYLIYFGGGDGLVYALDLEGKLRWTYDTLIRARNTDYPNINASVALGHHGLVVACSTGDVVWIPYDAYLRPNAEGFSVKEVFDEEGVFWHFIEPGGKMHQEPIRDETIDVDPTTIISLRLIEYDENNRVAVELKPKSIKTKFEPHFKHRVELQSDGRILNLIPTNMLKVDNKYSLNISCTYISNAGISSKISSTLKFKTRNTPQMASILSKENSTFRIVYMAVPQPTIVPSLDQIGLASLNIPFSIIDADHESKTFSAFAVQKFGEVGVPLQRISTYAFTGRVQDEYFQMECRNCEYEITSFAIPLDVFRISGFYRADGTVAKGGSLWIEKDWGGSMVSLMRDLAKNSPISPNMLINMLKSGGIKQFLKAGKNFFPALMRQLLRGTWQTWGLLNTNNKLLGVGTFRLEPLKSEEKEIADGIEVLKFEFDQENNLVMAEANVPKRPGAFDTVMNILLIDKGQKLTMPINYNKTKVKDLGGTIKRIELKIPKNMQDKRGSLKAHLMADIYPIKTIEI